MGRLPAENPAASRSVLRARPLLSVWRWVHQAARDVWAVEFGRLAVLGFVVGVAAVAFHFWATPILWYAIRIPDLRTHGS